MILMVGIVRNFRKMLGRRHTVRAHFWQSMATYMQQGFGLLLGIVLARLLTPQDFGNYAFALATVSLVLLPASWNISALSLADAGRTPGLVAEIMGFAWAFAVVKILLTLFLGAVFWAAGHPTTASLAVLIGLSNALRDPICVPMYDLQGRGDFKSSAHAEILASSLCFLIAIPAALFRWGPFALVLPGFAGLFAYYMVFSRVGRCSISQRVSWRKVTSHIANGFWLWVNGVGEVVFSRVDTWFIGRIMGPSALGFYARAYNYGPIALLVMNSLARNPTLMALARAGTWIEERRILVKTTILLLAGGALNFAGLYLFADPLVVWIFGEPWRPSIPLFRALAGFSVCSALFWVPVNLLFAHRRYREAGLIRAAGSGLLAVLLLAFCSSMSLVRVCWLVQLLLLAQAAVLWPVALGFAKRAFSEPSSLRE